LRNILVDGLFSPTVFFTPTEITTILTAGRPPWHIGMLPDDTDYFNGSTHAGSSFAGRLT